MRNSVYIEYAAHTGVKREKKINLWRELIMISCIGAVVSIVLAYIPSGTTIKEGAYYVTGLYSRINANDHTKKTLYYITTKKPIKEGEKVKIYDYYFIPTHQMNKNVIYKTGDKIILENICETDKSIISNDASNGCYIVFTILFALVLTLLIFLK